ncbi:helix-turn-helix domain-containing protein [Lysinibacillus fusiformis]|uniref:helix-turn-helix domain-containing protein n=1 Tax=Lysinibacillus fusiformis TaxID=28031 RepID=UPI0021BDF251|nr:helix-turn-helix transcriptional regulator [Lysinibacillus fusiformis]UXJ71395.1 helix-turn-helix domain-containing protein [Lysinibacillus fusiformis]
MDFNNLIVGKTGSGKMHVSHLHLFLKRICIENNETIQKMSDKLGLDLEELSAIENGQESIPEDFFSKIYTLYQLPIEFGSLELWNKAEQHLYDMKLKYEKLNLNDNPALGLIIINLIVRFQSGERSRELHTQILDLEC